MIGFYGQAMTTTRSLFLALAGLATASTLLLSAALRFPEVLLDPPSIGAALVAAHPVAAVVGLLGLFACGLLILALSRARRRFGRWSGWLGGFCLIAGALATMVLVPSWDSGRPSLLAGGAFWCMTVGSAVLAAWTVAVARELGRGRVVGMLGAAGLLLVTARSVLWVVNTARPAVDGYWVASSVLTVLALLGFPLWLYWLVRMGTRPVRPGPVRRLGIGGLGFAVVLAHAAAVTVATPTPVTDDLPGVPSPGGAAMSVLMLGLAGRLALPTDVASLRAQREEERYAEPIAPDGVALARVDANGVVSERICAPGAAVDRAVLYLHGGGFVLPVSNGHREFAATLSRMTGACVLLPHYRNAPDHPFPAPVEDVVRAYRWLREQGIAARRIVLLGDSCGGTFALSAALVLRDAGDQPPAALVTLSGGFDLTLSGETHRTKAGADALLGSADVRFSVDSYTAGADPRDPLVSPLFADVRGLPPTLLVAGTQEVLASDSVRMADHLRNGGVPVRLAMWPGMPHDFPVLLEEIAETRLALRQITAFVAGHVS